MPFPILALRRLRAPRPVSTEWPWFVGILLAVLLLAEVPYLLAFSQQSAGFVLSGMFVWPHDYAQYAAAMREGAASAGWLIHDRLTAEDHRPALIYVFYVALGKLAAMLGADVETAYHVAGLVGRALLMYSIYALTRRVLPTIRARRTALILAIFGSGVSITIGVPLQVVGVAPMPAGAELTLPEFSTFLDLFAAPHLIFGLALLMIFARLFLLAEESGRLRHGALCGLVVLALALVNSYSLATVCCAAAAHAGVGMLTQNRLARGTWLALAATYLVAVPYIIYAYFTFSLDPFWGVAYGQQNVTPSPSLLGLLLGVGALPVLALLAYPALRRTPSPGARMVVAWVVTSVLLMYLPVGVQRRFAFGLCPMLAILAGLGLQRVGQWQPWSWVWSGPGLKTLSRGLLGLLLFGSTAFSYVSLLASASRAGITRANLFFPSSLQAGSAWLAQSMSPTDILVAQTSTANALSASLPGRVYSGHWSATVDFARKEQSVLAFYRGDGGAEAQRAFLVTNRIRYVVYGPYERGIGAVDPEPALCLDAVFEAPDITIYEAPATACASAARKIEHR